jgi:HSP20 family protein
MPKKPKKVLNALVWLDHDHQKYKIQVELPGVKKEDIELHVSEQSLCVKGSREDADLFNCVYLSHSIDGDRTKAKYIHGILKVVIPFIEPIKGKKITIE